MDIIKLKQLKTKKKTSLIIQILIATFAFLAVIFACVFATRDGYSNWSKRLLYFTQLSNLWIGFWCVLSVFFSLKEIYNSNFKIKNYVYVLKFIFTVSITITGLIFCCLLAPFATYDVWSFYSVLTHVIVPILSIIDYFIWADEAKIKKSVIFLSLIPPFAYFVFAFILGVLNVDFGRGEAFPYFFFNFNSEVGLWGYKDGNPPQLGSGYWIIVICLLIIGIASLYYNLNPHFKKNDKKANQ